MTSLIALTTLIQEMEALLRIRLYLVGGGVRDTLLNNQPKDLDFATPSTPEEVELAIKNAGFKPYILGKRFGTIGFKYVTAGRHKEYIEITTFRTEVYSEGNRKPQVEFIQTIEDDLARRDFTINALALDHAGTLIDLCGGQRDTANKIIRCVGTPKQRFGEDPLRMLRAVRLAAALGFEIEDATLECIRAMKFEILTISKERWVIELDKILSSDNVRFGLELLMNTGLLGLMIPELQLQQKYTGTHSSDGITLWEHTVNSVASIPSTELNQRWSTLLRDCARPFLTLVGAYDSKDTANKRNSDLLHTQITQKICTHLKFSNERTRFILANFSSDTNPVHN